MFSWRSHPDEGQLLRFCDGELTARETSRIEDHIRRCWDCRTHIDEVRGMIGDYVRYRKDVLRRVVPDPPAPWATLSNEFRRLRDQETSGKYLTVFRQPFAWILAGLAAFAAAAATVVLVHPDSRPATPQSDIHAKKSASAGVRAPEYRASQLPAKRSEPLAESTIPKEPVGPEDELKVIAALHRIGADLGDPVSVTRRPEKIVISGAGLEPGRIAQLQAAVATLPNVTFDFATPGPPAADTSPVVVQSGQLSPVQSQIARQFADHAAFQKFADQTLEASEEIVARAHAIRALADRFPLSVESQMSARSVSLLAAIRKEHVTALARAAEGIDRSVMPVLQSLHANATSTTSPPTVNWQELADPLLSTAEKMDQVIGTMLATTTGSSAGGLNASAVGSLAGSPRASDAAGAPDGMSATALGAQLADALSELKKHIATFQHLSEDGQARHDR
jgi:hypothetical protein